MLTFAIPYSGYGQLDYDSPLTDCPVNIPFYLGLSGGLNYSKINYNEANSNYLFSRQISLELETFISSKVKNTRNILLFGISYESKLFNIVNSSNQTIQLESSYVTIPIKNQVNIIELHKSIQLSLLLGGFYSFKLIENSRDDDIEYLPNGNYGLIVGSKIEHILRSGVIIHLEYNFQYAFASIENTIANSGNVSHLINVGFKFPSTIF